MKKTEELLAYVRIVELDENVAMVGGKILDSQMPEGELNSMTT